MTDLASIDIGHIGPDELPWVGQEGAKLRLLRVDLAAGDWVIHNIFSPGFTAPRHRHTGAIDAFTISGCWRYLEYGIDYVAGTYVYEPANSVHTLHVPADNDGDTEVVFVMRGANLNLDADDKVESITDSLTVLTAYRMMCNMLGYSPPAVLGAR